MGGGAGEQTCGRAAQKRAEVSTASQPPRAPPVFLPACLPFAPAPFPHPLPPTPVPLPPQTKYASMLAEKVEKHGTHVWLINTGEQPAVRCSERRIHVYGFIQP